MDKTDTADATNATPLQETPYSVLMMAAQDIEGLAAAAQEIATYRDLVRGEYVDPNPLVLPTLGRAIADLAAYSTEIIASIDRDAFNAAAKHTPFRR